MNLENESRSPKARVAFARIGPVSLAPGSGDELAAALESSLIPGTSVERYGRVWRMGQWRRSPPFLFGRIGFELAGAVTELWNERANDFEPRRLREGTTSPFAIRRDDLRVAFQLRPGRIRPTSFTAALQALMNEASDYWRWRVEHEVSEVAWRPWVESVDRITKLEIKLQRPNPNYRDRASVESIIEGARLRALKVIMEAPKDSLDGIDLDDLFVREALGHAAEYGSWRATGETTEDRETKQAVWRSDIEGVASQRTVEADPESREVPPSALESALEDESPKGPS